MNWRCGKIATENQTMGYPQDFNQNKAFFDVRTTRWPVRNVEENENEHFYAQSTGKDISRSSTLAIFPAISDNNKIT